MLDCSSFGPDHGLYIVYAKLHSNMFCTSHPNNKACSEDVTPVIETTCGMESTCAIELQDLTVGDTCFNVGVRILTIYYMCISKYI